MSAINSPALTAVKKADSIVEKEDFYEAKETRRLADCDEFVRAFPNGYGTVIGKTGSELSGGERQRRSITHRMRTVAGAHKIVVLSDGVVQEQGTPEELLRKSGAFADRLMNRK